jgi:putative two-component system response regulator
MMINELVRRARLLIVDDEQSNCRLLERILKAGGYERVLAVCDSRDAEAQVDDYHPDLLLLDLHMPYLDGFGVLKRIERKLSDPEYLPVVMLTGDATPEAKRGALSLGARDFVAKPFDSTEVLLRIRNLLETRFLYRAVSEQNTALEIRVQERTRELADSQLEIVERLARAAEMRDDATGRHIQRVGVLSALIAEALGADPRFVELIRRAATLHDVGKIGIPDNILLKAGKLTPAELEVVRSHTIIGARILSGGKSELLRMAEQIALGHHEKWNGSGYPRRLAADKIPLEARIVALADFIDALSHRRPYRPAWPLDAVLHEVKRESGKHFDPIIVGILLETKCYATFVNRSVMESQEIAAVSVLPH